MSALMQELYSVHTTVQQEAHSYVDKDIANVCIRHCSE